ncbi:MAG: hypothetical protein ACI89L_001710 [Phycisphaerales bacterium]|jgi:hypothetical protein
MRLCSSVVGPLGMAALVFGVAVVLRALGTDSSLSLILVLGLVGSYVALGSGRRGCGARLRGS